MDVDRPGDARRLFDLEGRTAIVTGAARGIGRAVAEGLASVGVNVALADVLAGPLGEVSAAIGAGGRRSIAVPVDLCLAADRARLVQAALEAYGQIDILVNCAGVTHGAPAEVYPDADWERTLAVNLTAIFHLCKLVAADMIPRRAGVIVNVSSIGGSLGFPNNPAYQASKGGLLALTRALATDWARYNIRVNNLCPGYTRTEMTAVSYGNPLTNAARASRNMLNRWGEPSEFVGPVIFLASQASSYVTGSDLYVDGGWASSGLTNHGG